MSPPLGDLLRLGDEASDSRAELLKRAAVMDVTTVSVKAFPDWSDAEAKRAKRWLDDNGLRIGEVIPFYNGRHLGFHDREPHKTALESYSKQIHTSAILGAHCVGFGWGKEFGWPSPDIWSKKTWNERIAGVADLAEVAEREGVDIAAHPLYFTPLKSVERCKDLIGSVGSPRLKILLDLVNMCEPYMYHSTTDLVNQATVAEHVRHLKSEGNLARPLVLLPYQVTEAVKVAMKGQPRDEIDTAIRQAVRDVVFLFQLCQQLNFKILEDGKYHWARARLITTELQALQRDQALRDKRALDWMRVGMELSYPLDPETASAVAAAQKHHVLSWESIEEGDELDRWLLGSFVAEGKTALPDGAYLLRAGIRSSFYPVPSADEVRDRFKDAMSFQKFSAGEDYSYGLADVPDATYEERYEELLKAVRRVAHAGTAVDLPTTPHGLLREAPLVDGEWIDLHVVKLAEWGARICKNGHVLEDSEDNHPMAWCQIVGPTDGSAATDAATGKPWQQIPENLPNFPGRTREIEGRPYVSFADYVKWESRHAKGNLKSGFHDGIVVSDWNQWVDAQGGEGAAILAGVTVGKLRGYSENYRYHVCRDAEELADEVSLRDSLLDSLRPGRPGSLEEERYLKRVVDWKNQAETFLTELSTLRRATEIVEQLYFDGQPSLFVEAAEGLDQLVGLVQELIDGYNEDLASRLEDQQKLLSNVGSPVQELPLIIDLTRMTGKIDGLANDWVAYFVDMAKAEALGLLGETERAAVFADRHFQSAHTISE